jgi:hypothetical protein
MPGRDMARYATNVAFIKYYHASQSMDEKTAAGTATSGTLCHEIQRWTAPDAPALTQRAGLHAFCWQCQPALQYADKK